MPADGFFREGSSTCRDVEVGCVLVMVDNPFLRSMGEVNGGVGAEPDSLPLGGLSSVAITCSCLFIILSGEAPESTHPGPKSSQG